MARTDHRPDARQKSGAKSRDNGRSKRMVHQAKNLSPAQRAAAELLLGRPLQEKESISVQAFDPAPASEQRRREVSAELQRLFAEVDLNLRPATTDEGEDVFTEAMRSSRPGYRTHR
jgi:hypothetical protein